MLYNPQAIVKQENTKFLRRYNVIVVKSYADFRWPNIKWFESIKCSNAINNIIYRIIFTQINHNRFDYSGYYLIVLRDTSSAQHETIAKILSDFWSIYIVNVNVLATNESDTQVKMYTYFPYAPSHCEQAIPIVINHYASRTFEHPLEYPSKLNNMHGCLLIAAPLHFEPFVMYDKFENGSIALHGIEITILNEIAALLNFTVQSKYANSVEIAFEMVRWETRCFLKVEIKNKIFAGVQWIGEYDDGHVGTNWKPYIIV